LNPEYKYNFSRVVYFRSYAVLVQAFTIMCCHHRGPRESNISFSSYGIRQRQHYTFYLSLFVKKQFLEGISEQMVLPSVLNHKFVQKCLSWKDPFGSLVYHDAANRPYRVNVMLCMMMMMIKAR
jgi:hypothetical protein